MMNPAIAITLVLMATCCGRLAVRANIIDRGYGQHTGGHLCAGNGPKYRKISLIGGCGGGGLRSALLHPTASASIASTASVSVPSHLHGYQQQWPALATYRSLSAPRYLHHRGCSAAADKSRLMDRLYAKKSGGCRTSGKRLQLVGPTCCNSCGGCGGVHY